ncbi:MAG: hypothetical protein A3K19_17685 [Lentisphaerae bacterium RIFOXYB12_FULL_65_16]|nr:MAG: hypothetical protein A3K18_28840 [Lentisphaerae bacterium RIFOXYA12_64_32]OGV90116.1 MAG: hypothetical protein A3K19_17685 [Lentisphaerae bacterium RIFOXYB12_FULL_65_16]
MNRIGRIAWAGLVGVCLVAGLGPLTAGTLLDVSAWQGGALDPVITRGGAPSLRWAHAENPALSVQFNPPADWSGYGALSFWLHSGKATGAAFMLIIPSENAAEEGSDYYSYKITVDWTDWRQFLLPLRELGAARNPVGWNKVDGITLTASGWDNTPNPETVLHVSDVELLAVQDVATSDEEFFTSLDLARPDLVAVKAAVDAKDWVAATREFARHIRERQAPRWTIDWRDHPFLGVKVPAIEEDRAPGQWDYYSTFVTVDWEGWKRFELKKSDFQGEAVVEGKGKQGKKPIGWQWIKNLSFHASGWELTPNPETVLCFDDIALSGPTGRAEVATFETEGRSFGGLERTNEQAHGGQFAGKWGNPVLTSGITLWRIPHDWTGYDQLEFWLWSAKATGGKFIIVLDSDPPQSQKGAEAWMQKKFAWSYAGGREWSLEFKDRIDWHANPTEGEFRTHLWNESLHRHAYFTTLARAYWETGNERYATALAEMWMDWIRCNPRPRLTSGNGNAMTDSSWQTLTTGIRLENVWLDALYRCLGAPPFTDEAVVAIVRSFGEQARHLRQWPSSGNWLTEESMGLYTAGMMFPEFRDAPEWRKVAVERLYRQLDDEVYPDGMEYELASGYSNWVVSNVSNLVDRADMNGLRAELPADYLAKIEKMYNYQLLAMMPNGALPGLNDSGPADVRGALARGYSLFPGREDFLFGSTLGARGTMPAEVSHAFPYCGHYVMRSGWDKDAVYLLFDSGPLGYGHEHEDKLHVVLWAYGRELLLDPGNYSYDRSKWRRYAIDTPGHNTILVDGLGQNRRAHRAKTLFWPRPWDKPVPPDNDTLWQSTEVADFARGTYRDGYGPKADASVEHTRRVLFVKPRYYIMQDTLRPSDTAEHAYEALFHLSSENAVLDETTLAVRTQNADTANLLIVPLAGNGLAARVVKGQEDPVQGWANGPWRPVPTAVYARKGSGMVQFAYVCIPLAKGEDAAGLTVEAVSGAAPAPGELVFEVRVPDGTADVFRIQDLSPAGTALVPAGASELQWTRRAADGTESVRFAVAAPTQPQ